jgi:hypothetical protein
VPAASIIGEMRFLSVHQLPVAACPYRFCIALFQGLFVQVAAPTQHTTGKLLAVSPDMAEVLALVALYENSLGFARHCSDCHITKAYQFGYVDLYIHSPIHLHDVVLN